MWSDPTYFKPERFENETQTNKLLPFGLGRRACSRSNLAHRTVTLALALLIQCFEWKRTSNEKINMIEGKGLTMARKFPLEAMCQMSQSPTIRDIFSVTKSTPM